MIDLSNENVLYNTKLDTISYNILFALVVIVCIGLVLFIGDSNKHNVLLSFLGLLFFLSPLILIYKLIISDNVEVFITEEKLIKTGWGPFEKPIERKLTDISSVELEGSIVTIQGGGEAIRLHLKDASSFKTALEERLKSVRG